jgi:anti-sigma factor RsiW
MNCQRAREIFPELLDPRTAPAAHLEARTHLAHCPECQREFAALSQTALTLDQLTVPPPSPRLRQNFYAMLEQERQASARPSVRPAPAAAPRRASWRWVWSPLAGATLAILGFIAGTRYAPAPAAAGPDDATKRELVEMRQQLNKMTQLVGYSLLQQQSGPANERLRSVLASASTAAPNDKVLDDLLSAVAFDPSANVRLRALEALYPHAQNATVRAGVVAALPREQNPLVQLELIDFVAAARDREATPTLIKMSQNEALDRAVRDGAVRALAQL